MQRPASLNPYQPTTETVDSKRPPVILRWLVDIFAWAYPIIFGISIGLAQSLGNRNGIPLSGMQYDFVFEKASPDLQIAFNISILLLVLAPFAFVISIIAQMLFKRLIELRVSAAGATIVLWFMLIGTLMQCRISVIDWFID